MTKPKLRIGLIGSGFMGKAHAFGYTTAARVFDLPFELELHTIADIDDEAATKAAAALGFSHATSDWRQPSRRG
jgi:predicted dehydrogenase